MTTKTTEHVVASEHTIASRLYGLLDGFLKQSELVPSMYHKVILNFVKPYLQKTSDSDLREQIEKIRDEIIPFLLSGE